MRTAAQRVSGWLDEWRGARALLDPGRPGALRCPPAAARPPLSRCADPEKHQPWWYADLEAPAVVLGVSITTRSDCCWTSLGGAHVLVGNEPFAGPQSAANYQLCGRLPSSGINRGRRLTLGCGLPAGLGGRYVAVFLPKNTTSLTLCEVDVTTAASR